MFFINIFILLTFGCTVQKKTKDHDWLEAKAAAEFACHRIPLAEHDIFFQDLSVEGKNGMLKARSRNGETRFYPVSLLQDISKNYLKDISPDKNIIFLQKFFHAATKKNYLIGLHSNSELKIYDEITGKVLAKYFDPKTEFVKFEVVHTNGQAQIFGFYSETQAILLEISSDLKISFIRNVELSSNIRLTTMARDSVLIQAQGRKFALINVNATLKTELANAGGSIESFNVITQGKSVYIAVVEGESMASATQLQILKKDTVLVRKNLIKDSAAHFSEPGLCSHNSNIYVSAIKWLDQDAVLSVFKLDQNLALTRNKNFALMSAQNHIVTSEIVGSTFYVVLRSKAENGWDYDVCSTELF